MKSLSIFAAILAVSAPLSAQALNETFDTSTSGVFPPAGWAVTVLPGHTASVQWEEFASSIGFNSGIGANGAADSAAHGYDGGGIVSDNRLETPDMDLSSYAAPQLTYDGLFGWSGYMSYTGGFIGDSWIDVSTDGGTTWANVWQEASTVDYYTLGIMEDLTATSAGQSQVRIGFHYEGEYAHEWGLDNVVVDNVGPTGPGLSIAGTCPGVVSVNATGMSAAGPVVFAYGLAGSFVNPASTCNGLVVPIASPTIVSTVIADASGNASITGSAPANACGNIFVVAADIATCVSSGAAAL